MRTSLLQLPLALAILAPLGAAAQDAPRVIFCQGACFAVDANGDRTPAQKGTRLREGQRLETGPGAYAQLKIGANAALGVGEGARLGFDQKSVRDNDVVMLDRGRVRILDGDALNQTVSARHVELRTSDGVVAMRGGDMEAKKLDTGTPGANLTYLKLNAGDASLRSGQTSVVIPTTGVLGVTAGKNITDRTFSVVDVALLPTRVTTATGGTATGTGLATLITGMVNLPPPAALNTPLTTTGGSTISSLPVANLAGVVKMPILTSLAVTNVAVFAPTNATLFTPPPVTITQTVVPVSLIVPQKVLGDVVATLTTMPLIDAVVSPAPMPSATTTTGPITTTITPATAGTAATVGTVGTVGTAPSATISVASTTSKVAAPTTYVISSPTLTTRSTLIAPITVKGP
jgi:hypothetical protein